MRKRLQIQYRGVSPRFDIRQGASGRIDHLPAGCHDVQGGIFPKDVQIIPHDIRREVEVVGIQKGDPIPAGEGDRGVCRPGKPLMLQGMVGYFVRVRPNCLRGVVGRTVVDDEDFHGGLGLHQNAVEALAQRVGPVVRDDDNADLDWVHADPPAGRGAPARGRMRWDRIPAE